jgi:N-acetylglucosamine-6-phosphate deacetylase
VFNFASTNPAKLINLTGRGEIKVGNIADLVMVDHKMTIKKVFLAGEQVYDFSNGGF